MTSCSLGTCRWSTELLPFVDSMYVALPGDTGTGRLSATLAVPVVLEPALSLDAHAMLMRRRRRFDMFPHQDGGGVLWRDAFYGLVQLIGGDPREKAHMCFLLYDEDGSGDLSIDEVRACVGGGVVRLGTGTPGGTAPLLRSNARLRDVARRHRS